METTQRLVNEAIPAMALVLDEELKFDFEEITQMVVTEIENNIKNPKKGDDMKEKSREEEKKNKEKIGEVKKVFHEHGVNLRYLGTAVYHVRKAKHEASKQQDGTKKKGYDKAERLIWVEMVARVARAQVCEEMREKPAKVRNREHYRKIVVDYLNNLLADSVVDDSEKKKFWEGQFKFGMKKRFVFHEMEAARLEGEGLRERVFYVEDDDDAVWEGQAKKEVEAQALKEQEERLGQQQQQQEEKPKYEGRAAELPQGAYGVAGGQYTQGESDGDGAYYKPLTEAMGIGYVAPTPTTKTAKSAPPSTTTTTTTTTTTPSPEDGANALRYSQAAVNYYESVPSAGGYSIPPKGSLKEEPKKEDPKTTTTATTNTTTEKFYSNEEKEALFRAKVQMKILILKKFLHLCGIRLHNEAWQRVIACEFQQNQYYPLFLPADIKKVIPLSLSLSLSLSLFLLVITTLSFFVDWVYRQGNVGDTSRRDSGDRGQLRTGRAILSRGVADQRTKLGQWPSSGGLHSCKLSRFVQKYEPASQI